ncbi:MAG: hypothetical protein ACQZ3N_06515 [cyanobacterium endosymbiont of Rhopalodia yunnanensis]
MTELVQLKFLDLVLNNKIGVYLAITRHGTRATKGKQAYGKVPIVEKNTTYVN